MSEQGDPVIVESRVTRLLDIQKEQLDIAEQTEYQIMKALWDLRGSYRVDDMVIWTGWSRQTIYNKWAKHGFKVSEDAKPT